MKETNITLKLLRDKKKEIHGLELRSGGDLESSLFCLVFGDELVLGEAEVKIRDDGITFIRKQNPFPAAYSFSLYPGEIFALKKVLQSKGLKYSSSINWVPHLRIYIQ
ncbi:MAG: hypothetical protein ABH881_00795 [bacterium]